MAKDGNTYAKRQRETLKRQKQEAKRDKRQKRKDSPGEPSVSFSQGECDADGNPPSDTEQPQP